MLVLEDVTLCCVDTANQRLALRALQNSRRDVRFGRSLLLTDSLPNGIEAPAGINVVSIAPIASRDAYSHFILKSLLPHIATTHVLLVQWDGYVCNPDAWDPVFLERDYIGAKWFWHDDGMRVGNGGFSLRSRRLLEALQDPRIALSVVEDETICRTFRPLLERDYGIRFADEALADRFSFEAAYPIGRPFGFHGLFNFCRVVPPDELARLPASFDDAIARSPQLLQLLRNCVAMGQWAAAAAIAERILAVDPASVEVRTLLSQAQTSAARAPVAGRNDPCPCGSGKRYKHCHGAINVPDAGAVDAQSGAVNVQGGTISAQSGGINLQHSPPLTPDARFAHAVQAHQRGELEAAERGYRAVLAAAPEHAYALHYLGVIHYQHNRVAEALPLLERTVERVPQEAEFHNNLGLALAASDRFDEAMAAHRRALALNANHSVAWNNVGLALQAMNELPAAIDAFHHALQLNSDFAQAHWNLGLALLAVAESADGWREYEWRLRIPELGKSGRIYPGPRWTGENPAGKTILLTREQGFGDTLQFVRFSRMLADRGAKVLLELQEPLARLLAGAPGVSGVCDRDPLPAYDAHLPLLSVAGALGITATTIPCQVPYLTPNPRDVTALAMQLEPYRGQRNIGLSWAGSARHVNDRRRSCPLAMLAPLFEMPDINWFSLQKDDGEDEIAAVPAAARLIQLDARNDFDRKAALVSALDLVISVDTSNAHLAGALARPVWVLLPFAADWRWHVSRSDSPWYPTARLFRQPRIGDWNAVIADVQRALAEWR